METWKDIPGYEGLYQASKSGEIRTKPGKTTSNARYKERVWKTRVLRAKIQSHGNRKDLRVSLWKDGKEKTCLVSRLVCMTYCDGYAPDMTVNHINGNPLDNRAENLEWVTRGDNTRLGYEAGLFKRTQLPVSISRAGNTLSFRSLAACSRYLGKNNGYVSNAVKKGAKIYDVFGNEYHVNI